MHDASWSRFRNARMPLVVGGVVLLMLALAGCARTRGTAFAEPALPVPPTEPEPAQANKTFERVVLGHSVNGQELTMMILRGGPQSVLIIGGIHGNEQTSVDVAEGLLRLLQEEPHLAKGRTVAIFTNSNPDGYARRSRYNANMVDLNRNFAASNFKPGRQAGFRSGDAPNSEPETRAIVQAMEMIQPRLLISIHSIGGGRECNNYDGPAEHIAEIMSRYNGYPPAATMGYPTPGSLGSYAGIDHQIPMITLELPRAQAGEAAWQQNRDALLAAIAATP